MGPKSKLIKPVVVYTRVSEQGRRSDEELLSHELQRARVEQYLAAKGIPVAPELFEDNDRTGGKMSRPAFDRALTGIRSGEYGGIAVARLSRFGRNTSGVLELIYELEQRGASVIILDPPIDTSTAAGRAMLTVFAAFATMEREQAVEQAALVAEKKLAEGKGMGGWAALGYEFESLGTDSNGRQLRGWIRPSADAEHVRAAYDLFVAPGGTPGKVADFLNALGLRTGRGRRWGIASARRLLMNEVYIGVRKYGDVRIPDAHEAIVPASLWRKAVKKLGYRYTGKGDGFERLDGPITRTKGEGHLLGSEPGKGAVVRCGTCGASLVKGSANGSYPMLRCLERGPGHASISYRRAAEYIVSATLEHIGLMLSEMHLGDNGAELEAAEARLAHVRADLAEVEAAEDELSPLAFGRALDKARKAVEEAEDALAAIDRADSWWMQPYLVTMAGGNRLAFEAVSIPDKRRFLHEQIVRATLKPGRGAPEKRLEIEWKHEPGPRTIEAEGWTVLEFSEQAGLAFKAAEPDTPITSETIDMLREKAAAEPTPRRQAPDRGNRGATRDRVKRRSAPRRNAA
jgi:DNA invertase Pin-like site-specific DNA recombinase